MSNMERFFKLFGAIFFLTGNILLAFSLFLNQHDWFIPFLLGVIFCLVGGIFLLNYKKEMSKKETMTINR